MGSDSPLPGGGADPPGPGRRVRDRRLPGHQPAVRGLRRRHPVTGRGRAAARSRRLPRRTGGESATRIAGLHPDRRARRPSSSEPVVDLDAGGELEASRGPGQLDPTAARSSRGARGPRGCGRLRSVGWAPPCRPRQSGSTRRAAAWSGPSSPGATRSGQDGSIMANTWDGLDFPWRSTGETGWLRTSPVGQLPRQRVRALRHGRQRVGVDRGLVDPPPPRRRRRRRAACRRTLGAATWPTATTPRNRSSGSAAR